MLKSGPVDFKWINPLEHFREFSTTPKMLLLVGILIFLGGLPSGLTFHNPVLVFATTLLLLALAINMFQKGIGNNAHPPHNFLFDWEKMLGGTILLLITAVATMWFLQTAFKDNAPPWVKAFWQKVITIVWQ